jgi:transcriptional regulator with XRE-family HTH domain
MDGAFRANIGQRLKHLRERHKLSRAALAEKLSNEYYMDISEKSIQRYEEGKFFLKTDKLICLAELFNTTLDFIVFGKESSDDNSCTLYDNFKRMNRLVYSLSINFAKHEETGKIYMEWIDEEANVYWERLQKFAVDKNYFFEYRGQSPVFTLKDLDELFTDFIQYDEQLSPTKERMDQWLKSQGIKPEKHLKKRLSEIESKRKK